jgi:hypothetical protein
VTYGHRAHRPTCTCGQGRARGSAAEKGDGIRSGQWALAGSDAVAGDNPAGGIAVDERCGLLSASNRERCSAYDSTADGERRPVPTGQGLRAVLANDDRARRVADGGLGPVGARENGGAVFVVGDGARGGAFRDADAVDELGAVGTAGDEGAAAAEAVLDGEGSDRAPAVSVSESPELPAAPSFGSASSLSSARQLHPVFVPTGEVRELRGPLAQRDALVRDRTTWLVRANTLLLAAGSPARLTPGSQRLAGARAGFGELGERQIDVRESHRNRSRSRISTRQEHVGPRDPFGRSIWSERSVWAKHVVREIRLGEACGPRDPLGRSMWSGRSA